MDNQNNRIILCWIITLIVYIFFSHSALIWLAGDAEVSVMRTVLEIAEEFFYGEDDTLFFILGGILMLWSESALLQSASDSAVSLVWQVPIAIVIGVLGPAGILLAWMAVMLFKTARAPLPKWILLRMMSRRDR